MLPSARDRLSAGGTFLLGEAMTPRQLASMIDHTLLRPESTPDQVDRLCGEAADFGFYAVCVNPIYIRRAAQRLVGSGVSVVSVAGFPLGCSPTSAKIEEVKQAIDGGATEIDVVLHVGGLIAGEHDRVRDDIAGVAEIVHAASPEHRIKVVLETAVLSLDQIALACQCCAEARADFIKTSTGFHPAGGATIEVVRKLKQLAGVIKIKAAGGIRDLETTLAMIQAGADRVGTSASVRIIRQLQGD